MMTTKTDRELLELAAKAAGYDLKISPLADRIPRCTFLLGFANWNPLEDDGDALRLAVNLDISIHGHFPFNAVVSFDGGRRIVDSKEIHDPMQATRLAIVRAAAAIGESMP